MSKDHCANASSKIFSTFCAAGRGTLIAGAFLLSTVAPAVADPRPGDLATKWPVNDENPSASVPNTEERNSDPLEFGYFLQDLMARTQLAQGAENWPGVVKYAEALAVALPDMARPYSTLCVAYAKVGKMDAAQAYCARATNLQGSKVIDHLRFLDLTLRKEQLTQEDADAAEASLNHLRGHAAEFPQSLSGDSATTAAAVQVPETGDDLMRKLIQERRAKRAASGPPVADLPKEPATKEPPMFLPIEIELRACKLASLSGDDQKLGACMTALRGHKVDPRLLLPFTWAQALIRKDKVLAEQLMEEAKGLGLPDAVLASMSRDQDRVFVGPVYQALRWLAAAAAVLALAFYGVTRARKLHAARAALPQAVATEAAPPSATPPEMTTQG